MKKSVILTMLAAMAVSPVFAQKALVKVEYLENYRNWTDANVTNDVLLLAGIEESRYFNPMTQTVDSMLSTPQGTVQYNSMVEAANAAGQRPSLLPKSRTYIIKYPQKQEMRCFEEAAGELGNYSEPFSEQSWQIISDSTTTFLGYECVLAEADYHGRHWKAWFAPEIPLSDGPWKLCGLPGMILKATADNGAYNFTAKGLENVNMPLPKNVYGHDMSEKTDRKKMRQLEWSFYNNSAAQFQAQYGIQMQDSPLPAGFDLIETDYKTK